MKRGKKKRILAGLMAFFVAFTSLSWDGIAAMAQEQIRQSEKQGEEAAYTAADYLDPEEVTPADEIKEERTANKTVYDLGGNKRMEVIYSSDVRYKDGKGKWVDYDPALTPIEKSKSLNGNSLKGYAYTNSKGDNKNYLPEKLTGDTPVRMEKDGYSISFYPVMAREEEQITVMKDNDMEAANEEEESSEEEISDAENEEDKQTSEQQQEKEDKTTDSEEEDVSEEFGQEEEGISSIDSMSMEEDETGIEETDDTDGQEKEADNVRVDGGEEKSDSEDRTAVDDEEEIPESEEYQEQNPQEKDENGFSRIEEFDSVTIEEEVYTDAYDQESLKPLTAVYEDILSGISLEYQSSDIGIKENLILDSTPEQNQFVFEFKLTGVTVRHNGSDEGLTFYDADTGEIVAAMAAPNMNDATGNAYSEKIRTNIEPKEGEKDAYLLTLTVDREYLDDEDRVYPVTVDPTATWTGTAKFWDVYVCNGSYKDINFYDSGIKCLSVGNSKQGVYRTYLRFEEITKAIKGYYIDSAKIDFWETDASYKGETVEARRVKANWNPSKITWSNRPGYDTGVCYSSFKSSGVAGAKSLNVTQHVREIANGSITSYGLILRAANETDGKYVQLANSRYATASRRPKLTVVYYDPPATPTISTSHTYMKPGTTMTASWSGLTSQSLNRVEYRVAKWDPATQTELGNLVEYSSATKIGTTASGSATIADSKNWPAGAYKFVIRGVDNGGIKGVGKGKIIYIDGTVPTLTGFSLSPATSSGSYTRQDSPTLSWSGAGDDRALDHVEYWIGANGGHVNLGAAASGSVKVPAEWTSASGAYTFYARAVDKAGNVSAQKTAVYYKDVTAPYMKTMNLTVSGASANGYAKDDNPKVNISEVTESHSGIQESGIHYAITASGAAAPTDNQYMTASGVSFSKTSNPYAYSFPVSLSGKGTGLYQIYVKTTDKAGNASTAGSVTVGKDVTAPNGKIKISSLEGVSLPKVRNQINIDIEIGDSHSGIQTANLVLLNSQGAQVGQELITNVTSNTGVSYNTKNLDNGSYTLRLFIKDKVGNTKTVTEPIQVVNQMDAPNTTEKFTSNGNVTLSWEFGVLPKQLKEVEYQLPGGSWVKVPNSASLKGSVSVTLPQKEEGNYVVKVRGVDTTGIAGKEAQILCRLDKTPPSVSIASFRQGVLNGSVSDQYLLNWEAAIKKKGEDGQGEKIAQGTENLQEQMLAAVNLDDSKYEDHTWYTLILKATDKAGNQKTDQLDFYKNTDNAGIRKEQKFFIKAPSGMEQGEVWSFAANETFELEQAEGGQEKLEDIKSVEWYINGIKDPEQTGTSYEGNFEDAEKFPEGGSNTILALIKMKDGKEYITSPVYEEEYQSDETVSGEGEHILGRLHFTKQIYGFSLQPVSNVQTGQEIHYYVKAEQGEYSEIEPEKTYFISDLGGALASDSLMIKAVLTGTETSSPEITSYKLSYQTVSEQSFLVSLFEQYRPRELSAQDKINYKTYIKWETKAKDKKDQSVTPKSLNEANETRSGESNRGTISYELYRGTEKNFTPDDTHLVSDTIETNYWTDLNLYYGKSFYYKARAVEKDENGTIIRASHFSNVAESKAADSDEYSKRLGSQEYWGYTDFNTPNGNGAVELSQGNFYYSQSDCELPNSQLEFALNRSYNSQSSAKTSFGTGWDHNYNLELLSLRNGNTEKEQQLVYKDGTGTIYRFVPQEGEEGTYYSQKDKFVILKKEEKITHAIVAEGKNGEQTYDLQSSYTMTTKDHITYLFDAMGKILYQTEPNGTFLIFCYDDQKGFLSEVVTEKGQKLSFQYQKEMDGDCALVKEIALPDGTKLSYQYTCEENEEHKRNYRLASMTHVSKDGKDKTTYQYRYNDVFTLDTIVDAVGNEYGISYTQRTDQDLNKAEKLTQPTGDYLKLTYENGRTKTEKYANGYGRLYEMTSIYDGSGSVTEKTDALGNKTGITYTDGVVTSVTSQISRQKLDKNTGKVEVIEEQKKEITEYGERQNPVKEVDALGNTILSSYTNKEPMAQDLPTKVMEEGYDGCLLTDEEYDYDEYGNETWCYDGIEEEETWSDYDDDGNLIREIEYEFDDSDEDISVRSGEERAKSEVSRTTYVYDESGNVVKETEKTPESTVTTTNTYDDMGRVVESVSSQGETTKTTYDYMGRDIKNITTKIKGSETITETTTKTYDDNGTLLSETAKDGTTTKYTYDGLNRVIQREVKKGSLSRTYTTEYGYASNLVIQEGGGRTRTVALAEVETQKQGNKVLSVSYKDGAGQLIREKASGITTDYTYDKDGREIASYTEGRVTVKVYDTAGNVTDEIKQPEVREENGKSVYYAGSGSIVNSSSYNSRGDKTEETDGENHTILYGYHPDHGKLLSVSMEKEGKEETLGSYSYQTKGGLTTTTLVDALNKKSLTVTDSEGKEKTVADLAPDGAAITTQYQYDENGQKVKETYQDGSYVEYFYDAAGKVKEQTAFQSDGTRTLVTRYEYDDTTDQLLAMKDYKVTGGEEEPLRYTGYAYDDFGRIAAYTEVDGDDAPSSYKKGKATVEYKYNGEDELTEVLYPDTGDSLKGLLFCYDENGWLTEIKAKMTGTLTDGTVREYTYDTDGKVKEIRDYTSFDHLVNISPDYILRRYTYDDLDRVTSMKYMDGKNQDRILEEYAYTYDKNDNILTERIINHTPSGEEEKTDELRSHSYDEKGQLTKTVLNDYRNQKTTTIQYEYDKAGNRTKYSVKSGEEETETTYAYNGLHQLTASIEKRNGNTTSSITYTYDAKGNETKEADSVAGTETIYAYDVLNQLSNVTRKAGEQVELIQENWYNGEGKRIQKSEKGTTTRYFYDNGQVLYTLNKEDEKTTQNLSGISDNVIATKRYEGDDEGGLYFYNKDVKGSTSSILDDNLNGIVSYDYDDYGVTEKRGDEGFLNEICYTGGIYDDSTSLYYLNARYYDPSTGRFLSEDTYRGEPADANTWHLYVYCANNPVNYVDPSGHSAVTIAARGLIAIMNSVGTSAIAPILGAYVLATGFYKITAKIRKKIQEAMVSMAVNLTTKAALKAIDAANAKAKAKNRIKRHQSRKDNHHIVPKAAKKNPHAKHARELLESRGMNVKKDPRNLVLILKALHVGLHTNAYYTGVDNYLSKGSLTRIAVFSRLNHIKKALRAVSDAIEKY